MTDSEITTKILRQIRDEIAATRTDIATLRTELKGDIAELRTELKTELEVTNARLSVVEYTVRDFAVQVVMLARYVKDKHGVGIEQLKKRVTKLEKKVG